MFEKLHNNFFFQNAFIILEFLSVDEEHLNLLVYIQLFLMFVKIKIEGKIAIIIT